MKQSGLHKLRLQSFSEQEDKLLQSILKNIFSSEELKEDSVCSILELTASDGKNYKTKVYNLDAILSVGYRVNSKNATLFRRWASTILKEHLLKGYSINRRLSELEKTVALHSEKIDFFVRTSLPPVEGIFMTDRYSMPTSSQQI